jgi:hypothetical protein
MSPHTAKTSTLLIRRLIGEQYVQLSGHTYGTNDYFANPAFQQIAVYAADAGVHYATITVAVRRGRR